MQCATNGHVIQVASILWLKLSSRPSLVIICVEANIRALHLVSLISMMEKRQNVQRKGKSIIPPQTL